MKVILRELRRLKDLVRRIIGIEEAPNMEERFFKSWNSFQNDGSARSCA